MKAFSRPDPNLDFYSPHYYEWMKTIRNNPFYQTPAAYGLDTNKPIIIGEIPAKGTSTHTPTHDYKNAFQNGWQGVMAWTSNGVDRSGSLDDVGPATRAFRAAHEQLVFPLGPWSNVIRFKGWTLTAWTPSRSLMNLFRTSDFGFTPGSIQTVLMRPPPAPRHRH